MKHTDKIKYDKTEEKTIDFTVKRPETVFLVKLSVYFLII